MNKSDLVLTREVSEAVVTAVCERITDALVRGERVELRGLGTFEVRQRAAHAGRNPKTGAPVQVPPRKVPFFRMGKELRAIMNPQAVPEQVHA